MEHGEWLERQKSQFTVQTFLLKDMKRGKIWGVLTWRGKSEVNGEDMLIARLLHSLTHWPDCYHLSGVKYITLYGEYMHAALVILPHLQLRVRRG